MARLYNRNRAGHLRVFRFFVGRCQSRYGNLSIFAADLRQLFKIGVRFGNESAGIDEWKVAE